MGFSEKKKIFDGLREESMHFGFQVTRGLGMQSTGDEKRPFPGKKVEREKENVLLINLAKKNSERRGKVGNRESGGQFWKTGEKSYAWVTYDHGGVGARRGEGMEEY